MAISGDSARRGESPSSPPGAKATLVEVVWRPLLSYAACQHNEKQRLDFAQDILRWLRGHTHGSRQVADVLDENVACYQPQD